MFAMVAILVLVLTGFAARLVHIQVIAGPAMAKEAREKRMTVIQTLGARGEITDADGIVLAASVERYHVTVNQKQVANYRGRGSEGLDGAAGVAARLAPVLGMNPAELGARLVGDRGYVILARNILPEIAREIRGLRLDGIGVEKVADRVYPKGAVAGSIVGFVNSNGQGLQGLEFALDETLKGTAGEERYERGKGGQSIPGGESEQTPAQDGNSVRLTIISDLQWKAEEQLRAKVKETGADSGVVVVMNPKTGEVLALAESTAFDPNAPGDLATASLTKSISDVFEPGSTSKVITMAAAIELGLVSPTEGFQVADRWKTPQGETIKDSSDHPVQNLTATGIFAESSNVGTVLIGERMSKDQRYHYLSAFGFGSRTGIELPGESPGLLRTPNDWHGRDEYAVLFGQAIATNAVQATSVFATVANGGLRMPPRLVAGTTSPDGTFTAADRPDGAQVVSPQTAQTVLSMMESAVTEGTGRNGAIPGYRVAGKTGTAQRFNPSGYTASFIGVAPVDDPQVVTAVILHNPRTSIYGGTVAAPVFSSVTGYALQRLGVPPSGTPPTLFPATWQ